MTRFRYLLLAVLLLGGQIALLAHATDLEAHTDGICEICLHSAPLDSGLLPVVLASPPTLMAGSVLSALPPFVVPTTIRTFSARGPPQAFSV